jgi:hypothetical protein
LPPRTEPSASEKIYILRNARLDPEWSLVKRQTLPITFKAIAGLLEYQGFGSMSEGL